MQKVLLTNNKNMFIWILWVMNHWGVLRKVPMNYRYEALNSVNDLLTMDCPVNFCPT